MSDLRTGDASSHTQQMVTLSANGALENGYGQPLSGGGLTSSEIGTKTVTNTPAAVFAGASALPGRTHLTIKVANNDIRVRVGTAGTDLERHGMPVEPGATLSIAIKKGTNTPLYAVSEGAHVQINVLEY